MAIERGEIRGVTANPTIFMNAITKSDDYDDELIPLAKAGHNAEETFWQLAIEDIQAAADLFRPLYDRTNGGDGYVSIEVSPHLADETEETLAETKELWRRVNRPNLMVKIPATREGRPRARRRHNGGIRAGDGADDDHCRVWRKPDGAGLARASDEACRPVATRSRSASR